MNNYYNLHNIKLITSALNTLNEKFVFTGGATISMYPDRQVFEVRPTDDVDVIIEILNYPDRVNLEEKLRATGFNPDIDSGITCRYIFQGIIVDILPTNEPSIGFNNKWYSEGFENAVDYVIDEKFTVKILSAPYFIATKFEAFKSRGKNDGRTSEDFEDIIYVLENRESIWEEMNNSSADIKNYLRREFQNLLNNPSYFEWIDGHTERGSPPASYFIVEQISKFTDKY